MYFGLKRDRAGSCKFPTEKKNQIKLASIFK